MENNIESAGSQNGEEVITNETPEVGLPADQPEVEPIEAEHVEEDKDAIIAKLTQQQQELYEQNRKLKGFVRDKGGKWVKKDQPQKEVSPVKDSDITLTELHSLLKANVSEEDTNEVRLYARSHGLTITDALKLPEVKAILGVKMEYRKSAEAANTRNARFGASKLSDEQILAEAEEGKLTDPATLAEIRDRKRMAGRQIK